MSCLFRSSPVPRCLSCVRNLVVLQSQESLLPSISRRQIRGKKTNAKDAIRTVKVRLLEDIKGYGAAGALIPVPPGTMRNLFYPKSKAQYLSMEEVKSLKAAGVPIERDYSFGIKAEITEDEIDTLIAEESTAGAQQAQAPRRIRIESHLLKPERATDLLETLLPSNLDFYRKPVQTTPVAPPPAPQRKSPSVAGSATLSAEAQAAQDARDTALKAAQEAELARKSEKVAIYGSVTTADIVANLKAMLNEDEEAKRIVFGTEEVSFIRHDGEVVEEDADRVKHLGVFEVEIKLKDAPFAVTRTIRVNAAE